MALSTYWLPLCPAHWLKLFLTKWLAPSHHWQKSSLYPVAQASRLAQSIPPLVSHPSVWFWLALSRLTSSRSIWEKAAAWLAPATLLQMHMQINGWQPEKACQVDIHSFIQNQVSSYKLVICYKWICGKINIQDIPVMSYIFFFSLWNTANVPSVNQSGRMPAMLFTNHKPFQTIQHRESLVWPIKFRD